MLNPTGGTPSTTYLHYDGDTLLFTTSATGQLYEVRPELLGSYLTGTELPFTTPVPGGFVVQDRDFSELNVTSHDAASYSAIDYGSGPLKTGKVTTTSDLSDAKAPSAASVIDATEQLSLNPNLQYTHPDGFTTPLGVIQGVRAMDPNLGTWKSPDAYSGDVRDPMSQKPYMWNGNNPYQYSDPSGYSIQSIIEGFENWYENVHSPGRLDGSRSGGLSSRKIEGIVKDQNGELTGFDHSQKFIDGLKGAMNRMNGAIKAGATDVADRAAQTYNDAVKALRAAGGNVSEALSGKIGGDGQTVKFPESISPANGKVAPEPIKLPEFIEL